MRLFQITKDPIAITQLVQDGENLLFVYVEKRKQKDGSITHKLHTRNMKACTVGNFTEYLKNPDIVVLQVMP